MTPLLKSKRNSGAAVTPHAVRRQRKRRERGPNQPKSKTKRVKTQKKENLTPVKLPDGFEETQGEVSVLVAQMEPLVMQEIGAYRSQSVIAGFEFVTVLG